MGVTEYCLDFSIFLKEPKNWHELCWNTLPRFCFTAKSYHMIVKRTKILEFFGSQVFIMKSMANKTRVHMNSAIAKLAA